jgi:transcriptional regulator with XRE-family HTH domain
MLNERIRALRLAKGLTLQQVGDVFGISRASVSAWESGAAKPDAAKLVRLADFLDTSLSHLLDGSKVGNELHQNASQTIDVPFIRWDLIEKNSTAQNPSQLVRVSCHKAPKGAFATRLVAPPDWGWQPGPIPAGAILIIRPCKEALVGVIALISSQYHPLQLATLRADSSTLVSANYLENSKPLQIKYSEITLIGEVLEWSLTSQTNCQF